MGTSAHCMLLSLPILRAYARRNSGPNHPSVLRQPLEDQHMQIIVGRKIALPDFELGWSIFLTPVPQKLTRFDASPLSITSRKSLIGPDQLAPVLRIYSTRSSL